MRVLIAVTHLLGIGHLARAAALGRAFAAAGHQVRLVSGGRPAPTVDVSGLEVVNLPPVHVTGTDFSTLLTADGAIAGPEYLAARQAMLCEAARTLRPDVVIIELFPFGRRQLRDEFLALIAALRQPPFAALIVCSIRDVLNPPSSAAKARQSARWLGLFDAVLCHADPAVVPLEASWPVDAALRLRLQYTGYIRAAGTAEKGARAGILVSGGGSAAALPLLHTALEAARRDTRAWRLLVGHAVEADAFEALQADAPGHVIVERARPDFAALLARAECSVSQFGYNTALDLAAARTPAVVVPFDAGRETEQTLRARFFAERGMVEMLTANALTPEALLVAIDRAITRGAGEVRLDISGAEKTVGIVARLLAEKNAEAAAWQALIAALERAERAGRRIRFWWRDDDAVEPTAALDDLLALARKHDAPLALAVPPRRATPALAARVAGRGDVAVMVHGIDHRNNAGPDAKKQELVGADAATCAGLQAGRERLAALFGAQAVPVLAPPWNRIADDVIAALPAAGYAGWSGFDGGTTLRQAGSRWDTHVDVIDWRGGGGLVLPETLLARVTALVDAQGPEDAAIGLLTHHLVHDGRVDMFLEALLTVLTSAPATQFVDANKVFGLTTSISGGRQTG